MRSGASSSPPVCGWNLRIVLRRTSPRQALAKPADLAPMIYLVLEHVKPLEVIVCRLVGPKESLLVEPIVSTPGKFAQRFLPDVFQQPHVVVQGATSDLSPCVFAQL